MTIRPPPAPQHLATFIMDKSEAIVSVEDAIRKLVQLSSKEKIWTQEMLLQVNDQSLRLLDVESQVGQGRPDPEAQLGLFVGGRDQDKGKGQARWPGRAESPGSYVAGPHPRRQAWPGLGLSVQQRWPPLVGHVPCLCLPATLVSVCCSGPAHFCGCEPTSVPRHVPQEELENFPLPTVRHSQTVLNQLRYPSVLLLVCQDSEQNKPDIHFFHCDEVEVSRGRARGTPPSEPA